MLPKSYIVFKWTVYGLATIALFAFQYLVLDQITVWGLTPFLYPMLPAVAASYEGLRRGSGFALVLGEPPLPRLSLRPGGIRSVPPAHRRAADRIRLALRRGGFPPHGGDRPGGDVADPPGGRCCVSAVPVGAQEVYG